MTTGSLFCPQDQAFCQSNESLHTAYEKRIEETFLFYSIALSSQIFPMPHYDALLQTMPFFVVCIRGKTNGSVKSRN